MRKLLSLQLILLLLSAFSITALAQDSAKKASAARAQYAKPVVKPGAAYPAKPNAYYKPRYYRKPGDTGVHAYQHTVADTAHKPGAPDVTTDKSLSGQYQYVMSKIYGYQQPLVAAFHKSIMDTLRQTRSELKGSLAKVNAQSKMIDSLQNVVKSSDQSLNASNAKVDAIDMFGISLPKSTYNLIMWGIVVVLGVIAAIVIARSGSYSREAKYRVQLYNELDEEYKNYKLKANEKEKKLARELQTERNKLDDMMGRG